MKKLMLTLAGLGLAATMLAGTAAGIGPRTAKLTIVHLQKGCHSWSNGKTTSASAKLQLHTNGRLVIANQDIDTHRLVQLAGPARVATGGTMMMMNKGMSLVFKKAGVYRFKTVTVEMPGEEMPEVETDGPDHNLLLTVHVGS